MGYVRSEYMDLLFDVWEVVEIWGDGALLERFEAFMDEVTVANKKATDSARESMRRFRAKKKED